MNIILSFVILLGVGHKNFAIEIADAEWSITCRKVGVDEAAGINLMKILIEGVDVARMEICRIQEVVIVGDAERCAFVNGTVNAVVCSVIHSDYSVRRIHGGVPTGKGTIFADKNENGGRRVSICRQL